MRSLRDNQACESDCELSAWTKWIWCSKDCDGGAQHRVKHIVKRPEGNNKWPWLWSLKRLQYNMCNTVQKCKKELDIVFLIDGSGSLGSAGWKAEIKAAETFVDCCHI